MMLPLLRWITVIALCFVVRAFADELPEEQMLAQAQTAFDAAARLRTEGKYADALSSAERALALRESVLGSAHPGVATCLNLVGDLCIATGDYDRAKPLIERGLAIREATLGKKHPEVAESLVTLGEFYYAKGRYSRAVPLFDRALAIREATLGKNHPDVAAVLTHLAAVHRDVGAYSRAEPLLQRALAIYEATLGQGHPRFAGVLSNLGSVYYEQRLYDRAEPLLRRALAIRESALSKNHPDVASSLIKLAMLYREQALYDRAEPLFQRALAIQEEVLGKNHPDVEWTLNHFALFYDEQGLYGRAEPLYRRALAISESANRKDDPNVADVLNNLASLYLNQGVYGSAEPLLQRALVIAEAAGNKIDLADVLSNLAALYVRQQLYSRAEPLFRRALAIYEGDPGIDRLKLANALNNMACSYMEQGAYGRAASLYRRALAIYEATFGKSHAYVTASLNNLALLYLRQGAYSRAEPLFQRVLAIYESTGGERHPDFVPVLNNLAQLRIAQNRLADALPFFWRALNLSERRLRLETLDFSESRLTDLLDYVHGDEQRLYSLLRRYPSDARVQRLAFTAALLFKGRSAEEAAEVSRTVFRRLKPDDHDTFERLRSLRTQLAQLSLDGPGQLSPAAYRQQLEELAKRGDALEVELASRSAGIREFRALPSPDEILNRVAAALPPDGVLVEFISYPDEAVVPPPGKLAGNSLTQLCYLALVLFPDGHTRAFDFGPAAPIDLAAMGLRDALASRDAAYQGAAQALYSLVVKPLIPLLGGAHRLFVAPDGQLSLVPFDALHDGQRVLAESFDFTYLTSGKELLPRIEDTPPAQSVVVFADPDFGASSTTPSTTAAEAAPTSTRRSDALEQFFSTRRSALDDQALPPLPGTRKEAEAIKALLPQAQVLVGRDATKGALLTIPTPGILHIATHGFFLEDASAREGTRSVVDLSSAPQRPADPLLRSGLFLAGARAPGPSELSHHEGALVTALELASLDLWGTQMVVLSACDTGKGDVKLGQGVYGLRRALMVAGAETVVTSLWKVEDEPTRELMERFYQNLLAGQGRTTALRGAMRTLRQKWPHPHFWAPFIAIGRDEPLKGLLPAAGTQATH